MTSWWQLCFGFCTLSYTRSSILLAAAVYFFASAMATIPPNNQTPTGQVWYPGRIALGKTQKNKENHFPPVQQLEKEGEWTRWSREYPVQSEPPPPTQSQNTGRRSQPHPNPTTTEGQSLTQCRDLSPTGEVLPQPLGKTGRGILYRNRLDLSVPYLLNKFQQKYLRQAKLLPPMYDGAKVACGAGMMLDRWALRNYLSLATPGRYGTIYP